MHIFKFNSILKPVLWGGDKIVELKQLPQHGDMPIGESWELSAMPGHESVVAAGSDSGLTLTQLVQRYGAELVGEDVYRRYGGRFPLLFKFIDARRDLSIQVHPGDEMAMRCHGCPGKNEMWYILHADEGAVIRAGFSRPVTPEEYERRIADGSILDVINAMPSRAGAAFFIPSGQIHSIGAGNLLVEIQEACDITYRVYDYNRRDAQGNLRELHTRQAREALCFSPTDSLVKEYSEIVPGVTRLYRCPMFEVWRVQVDGRLVLPLQERHSFAALMGLGGTMAITGEGVQPATLEGGESALVPAVASAITIDGCGELLVTTVPEQKPIINDLNTLATSFIDMKSNKTKWIIGGIVALVVIAVACAAPYLLTGAPSEGLIKMRKGSTIESIGDSVQAHIDATYGQRVATMLSLMRAHVENREGAFRIPQGMSPFTAARHIKNGAQSGVRFTFNNVRTLDEWTQRWGETFMAGPDVMRKALNDSALCAKYGKTPQTIACLLMPDTYEFYWNITPEKMLDRMHDYYNEFWTSERKAKAERLGLTPDEVATVASIVEEETSKADERGKVARLYLNRYQQGMRLQADPTVKFAIGDFSIKRITVPMTQINSPYNTYRVNGLPPGPIRLPEKSTIDAVLDAPQHDYLYMCARADFSGYHDFTRDYASHLDNAHRYQAALNSRGIK